MSYFIVSSAPSGLMLSHKVLGEPISLKTLKILLILGWNLPFLADYAQTKKFFQLQIKKAHLISMNIRTKYVS